MSNGYYGPYQSRILNFISKQSRQVADNYDRTWRQVKQTTLSATQILLYPAYLLVQGSRMLSRQLRESSQKLDLPELPEFGGDENPGLSQNWYREEVSEASSIAQILELAENLLNSSQTATLTDFPLLINQKNYASEQLTSDLHPPINSQGQTAKYQTNSVLEHPLSKTQLDGQPKVCGIATFIAARTLVLVGRENRILDILTPEQQELLESRITWEVANEGPELREITQKELKFNLGLESAAKKAQSAPLRRFWELMAWLQTSPVAVNRNQFGESILAVKKAIDRNTILVQTTRAQLESKTLQQSIAASNSIDRNTPKLETNFNSNFDLPANPLSFVTLLDRAALNLEEFTLPPATTTTTAPPTVSEVKIDTSVPVTNLGPSAREILEKYAQNIEKMIWSSVDNLLGKETAASDNTEKSVAIKYYLKQRQQSEKAENSQEVDRPWLNWQDLFGESAPQQSIEASSEPDATDQSLLSQNSPKLKEEITEVAEGRSTAVSISPYPKAIHGLLAQLKQSLITKQPKSQPQKASNLAVTQENSYPPAAATPGRTEGTQVPKYTNPNTAQNSQSPAAITQQTNKYTPAATAGQPNQSATVSPEDEYLETKAESMGYIKHPLEQVLEWLDLLMVRLENILEQLWNWAKIYLPTILKTKDKID
ncbi:hypothetical protein IQ270_07885 [Microcoleus sp. LEGE 07076]|uniref:hypothetical protein n=1 Tax=Microcoleus sp. LEGE 07076 TaxID=915322 RepID=UPI00187EF834|nr:hypothetical protein [Microcoleus sp. LEGE 07076]MBE9184642.1 hypothetical protein [Microcoleus sp. LEGE 07076]